MLDQACAHCPIFPTAASRRSLGRVSVPVWLIILSDQLTIVALVGLYPANKLIVRGFLSRRLAPLALGHHAVLAVVSHGYPPPGDRSPRVTHPSATVRGCPRTVRLACVKHAASVRSEPGSNSQVHLGNPVTRTTKTNRPLLVFFRSLPTGQGPARSVTVHASVEDTSNRAPRACDERVGRLDRFARHTPPGYQPDHGAPPTYPFHPDSLVNEQRVPDQRSHAGPPPDLLRHVPPSGAGRPL